MIVAEKLTKHYGLKPAIQDISFRIQKGEIVGFLGPNGAGKTTILRILTCFIQPTSGRAIVDGLNCRTDSLEVRKRIGFLPETVPLYTELSVKKFLAFSGTVKGQSGNRLKLEIDRVIIDCGLAEHKKRLIKHLSKGLKQRVGLAQALLNNPPILILDEPTTGLDPAQIIEMRELMLGLGGERTILLSTHILPEVSQVCQRVIIVNQGNMVAEDTPKNLTCQLQKGLKTIISVDGPPAEVMGKLKSLQGVSQVRDSDRTGEFIVESTPNEDIRPLMAQAVVKSNWGLREMKSSELSLEEVFVHLVTEEGKDTEQ
ncbi:MAG: ATP-binding cassette domain-containing protein [Deltaproteobacteria bacterium]|nr:ATP-binding cassette domain-containing protein [Deltaproteobacteria bacterium]MBW1862862.1 ATP-binding cassette domain-containing protein [Deltaproteobacteria bacterium]